MLKDSFITFLVSLRNKIMLDIIDSSCVFVLKNVVNIFVCESF